MNGPVQGVHGGYKCKRSTNCINSTKKSLCIIVGMLTAHCILSYHLRKLRIFMDIACRLCKGSGARNTHLSLKNLYKPRHLGVFYTYEGKVPNVCSNVTTMHSFHSKLSEINIALTSLDFSFFNSAEIKMNLRQFFFNFNIFILHNILGNISSVYTLFMCFCGKLHAKELH